MSNQILEFTVRLEISKEDLSQLKKPSKKVISRRIWTAYKNVVLEWRVEFSLNAAAPTSKTLDFTILYVDGPSESIRFRCSLFSVSATGTTSSRHHVGDNDQQLVSRGNQCPKTNIAHTIEETGENTFHIRLLVTATSFDNVKAPVRTSESADACKWTIDLHKTIENVDSKYSDVRLISGGGHTFYCHLLVMRAQSDAIDAMFRNARTEAERNGTFRLSAWTTDELRKILEYLYSSNPDLNSSSIQQLVYIYDFAEQYDLDGLKKFVHAQLWISAVEKPSECAKLVRFADLHADRGLNPLKYRCYDVLTEKYTRLGLNADSLFIEDATGNNNGEPPSKKKARRTPNGAKKTKDEEDEVGIRLKNEFLEYSFGRIGGGTTF